MKTILPTFTVSASVACAAALLSCGVNGTVLAESGWSNVDECPNAQGYDLGTDASGTVFAVGGDMNADGTYRHAVVRKLSASEGWLNDYSGPIPDQASATTLTAFAADRTVPSNYSGRIYAGGTTAVGSGGCWLVCQSDDEGASWSSSAPYQYQPGFGAKCSSLAVDQLGNVYAVGYAYARNQMFWVVRKSSDGGTTWRNVDVQGGKGMNFARGIACATDANGTCSVFVVGYLTTSSGNVWTVRRSLDGGANWVTVDSLSKTRNSSATAVTVDAGSVYVVGFAGASGNTWTVRASSDGLHWATIDALDYGVAWGVAVANGNVYVVGFSGGWMVRQAARNDPQNWQISDHFQYAPGQRSEAEGITTDSSGNIFVTGYANGADGVSHWITRRLP